MSDITENSNVTELQVQPANSFSLTPKNLDEAMQFSRMIANSDICPKDFKGKAGNVLVAIQMGLEVGLPPMQAIQNIAVVNGRPTLWGDVIPALAKAHPKFEYMNEEFSKEGFMAICKIKRKGEPEQIRTFSQEDAQKANLWGKTSAWAKYPKRMCQMRARAFAIRDVFPDALKGIQVAEEVMDIPRDMGTAERVESGAEKPIEAELMTEYPEEQFTQNYQSWVDLIRAGKPHANIINKLSTTYTLTDEQKKKILEIKQ